jgi:hypothetical protein
MNFSCTVARLALVGKLATHGKDRIPTLCYGTIAALPYRKLDADTAFTFESISNALAVQMYDNNLAQACSTPDYSPDLSNRLQHSTYASLSAISALDLSGTVVIQGLCWWRLFIRTCKLTIFRCSLGWSLIMLALDAVAIYEATRTGDASIVALSALVL